VSGVSLLKMNKNSHVGSGLPVLNERIEPGIQILANQKTTSVILTDQSGVEQVIQPYYDVHKQMLNQHGDSVPPRPLGFIKSLICTIE
jgi:hypothetical protein